MTISSTTNRVEYTGNGSVSTYSYTFRIIDEEHLLVTVADTATTPVETTLALTTDYTVTGVGASGGGTIVLVNSAQSWLTAGGKLKSGYALVIRRQVPLTQETDVRNQGPFYPAIHEDALDLLVMTDQQQQDELDRSIKLPESVTSSDFDTTLPTDIETANAALVVNSSGDGWDVGPTTSQISSAQTYATNAANSATAAAASETAAAASETAAAASETAAAASASAASTSATNAANSASAASTSATNAANSASAASTSATNAASSASSASTSATNASNSASAASTSATNAANSASAASTSETNAASSASSASTSATNASNSATAAAASATTAANTVASFFGRDLSYKTFADSPFSPIDADRGVCFLIDCSGGNVVVNLPAVAGLTLSDPWLIAIKKTDSSSNTITVNRGSTDTFDDATTSKTIQSQGEGLLLIPDTDQAPDQWAFMSFGGSPSPLTTKGDLYTFSTVAARLGVGSNGQVLIPDSNQTLGLRYQDNYPKNYILNSDAEVDTTGWSTYAAAGNTPVDGTGGSPSVTWTRTTSTPLRGTGSFLFTRDAANRQGQGVSYDFSIDVADQAQPIAVQANYSVASGTFFASDGITAPLNDGTTSQNAGMSDLEFFMYDVTNARLIPIQPQVLTGSSSNSFIFKGIFQSAANSTSYRLCIHVARSTAVAFTMKFDQVFVGVMPVSFGIPAIDTTAYTPTFTGLGTAANVTFSWSRVADKLFIFGRLDAGTVSGTTATFTLPTGYTVASSTLINSPQGIVGHATKGGVAAATWEILAAPGDTKLSFGLQNSGNAGYNPVAGNTAFANSDTITVFAIVPCAGLSSNTVMSNDSDSRVVALSVYRGSSNQTISSTSLTDIVYNTVVLDTHAGFNTSTGVYTIPVSGQYWISANARLSGATSELFDFWIYKTSAGAAKASINPTILFPTIGRLLNCVAGDTIKIQIQSSTDTSYDIVNSSTDSFFNIYKVQGPAAVAATEKVFLNYTGNAGTALTADTTNIDWSTKVVDSHNAWGVSNTTFTAPKSAMYSITGGMRITAGTALEINAYVGAVQKLMFGSGYAATPVRYNFAGGIYLNAGDALTFRSTANCTLSNNATQHWITIMSQG